ncbi:hypothetical protein ACNFCJ_04270 [Pseudomonas sp. NY15364]|uniref:hypothetical protein n=1 Tax=Pseudomonas sp. NY15364 TaxID=3400353 RepID=UPI003A8BB381
MTEAEKWAACDSAKQSLHIIASHLSACIYAEEKREAPDQKQIDEWIKERHAMILLARSLTVDDMATIGRVRENYDQKAIELSK